MTDEHPSGHRVRMQRPLPLAQQVRELRSQLVALAKLARRLDEQLGAAESGDRLTNYEIQNLMSQFSELQKIAEDIARRQAEASDSDDTSRKIG